MEPKFSDVAAQDKAIFHVKLPVKAEENDSAHLQMNMYINIEKGDNFGQVMSQMAQMEQLQNTVDFQQISEVMQYIDSTTKCERVKRDGTLHHNKQQAPWRVGAQQSQIHQDSFFMG